QLIDKNKLRPLRHRRNPLPVRRRKVHALKTETSRLLDPLLDAAHRADLTAETDLSGKAIKLIDTEILPGRYQRRRNGQVDGRVLHAEAAGDIEKHILVAENDTHPFFEDGEQHAQAAQVEARGGALRRPVHRRGDEGLRFDEEGARAFEGGTYYRAVKLGAVLRQQELRGVR